MSDNMKKASTALLAEFQQKADEMKKKILSSPNLPPEKFTGKCYYFSNDGDDSNDGLSPEKAFKSMSMAEKIDLKRGDALLFRRGDLFRGSILCCADGITFSAWGEGDKPVLCGSKRNYADPELWKPAAVPGIWECTLPVDNAGIITFDHDPRTIGKYDALQGVSIPHEPEMEPAPLHLKKDLEFFSDLDTGILYLKSEENPGTRFNRIEIGEKVCLLSFRNGIRENSTVDNLHITVTGAHAVSFLFNKNSEVKNCVIDYVGGSVLWRKGGSIMSSRVNVRYGNAVEVYGGCSGFKVHDNWIYQIYDTGITHQYHWNDKICCVQEDVEYNDNLIEYCFWFIEYYNTDCQYSITRNVHVHDNFCRFGGTGWGCTPERWKKSPMCSFMQKADETENYLTEKNIFQFTFGFIYAHYPPLAPDGCLTFKGNTYIQYAGENFAQWDQQVIPFTMNKVTDFLDNTLKEEDYQLFVMPRQEKK